MSEVWEMKDQLGKLKARTIAKGRVYLTPELHKKLVMKFGTKWREVGREYGLHERTFAILIQLANIFASLICN